VNDNGSSEEAVLKVAAEDVMAEDVITEDCNEEVVEEIKKKGQEGQEVGDGVVLRGRRRLLALEHTHVSDKLELVGLAVVVAVVGVGVVAGAVVVVVDVYGGGEEEEEEGLDVDVVNDDGAKQK
jgi:hypothetical protein